MRVFHIPRCRILSVSKEKEGIRVVGENCDARLYRIDNFPRDIFMPCNGERDDVFYFSPCPSFTPRLLCLFCSRTTTTTTTTTTTKNPKGMHQQLRFRCNEGHEWLSTPSNLVYKNVRGVSHPLARSRASFSVYVFVRFFIVARRACAWCTIMPGINSKYR